MIKTLLQRTNERGIFALFYLSGEEAHGEPAGLYADITYTNGEGESYSKRVGSYRDGAHRIFRAADEWPEYARGI